MGTPTVCVLADCLHQLLHACTTIMTHCCTKLPLHRAVRRRRRDCEAMDPVHTEKRGCTHRRARSSKQLKMHPSCLCSPPTLHACASAGSARESCIHRASMPLGRHCCGAQGESISVAFPTQTSSLVRRFLAGHDNMGHGTQARGSADSRLPPKQLRSTSAHGQDDDLLKQTLTEAASRTT